MSSTIYYRFRSQKDSNRILFDGTGLTVFDLKREIIQENKLGDGSGFQLRLYNPDTDEEYEEDQTVVPRSTSVVARRSPATAASRGPGTATAALGNATRYVTGKPRVFASMKRKTAAPGAGADIGSTAMSEEDRIASMFANQESQWENTQQEMSSATPIFFKNNSANNDDGPPPPGYMCYRCGSRDHWIKNCPTNSDPNFEGKRIRRTTGIPKKFLRQVDIDPDSITPEEMAARKIMVTDEGKFVVQVADEHSWEDYQRKQQNRGAADPAEARWQKGHFADLPPELACALSGGLVRDAVRTAGCCKRLVSRATMEDALLQSDFVCPLCQQPDVLLDSLVPDEAVDAKVREFLASHGEGAPDTKRQHT